MKNSSFYKALAAVLLPFLILLAWWLKIAFTLSSGQVVAFGVTGYDPRDLLSGHYLTYRVQYFPEEPCQNVFEQQELCLCFGSEADETTWKGSCSALPSSACERYLKGQCINGRFEAGIERYYIPESYASSEAIPENSVIIVALDGEGGAVVKDFMVGHQRLIDWLRAKAMTATQNSDLINTEE
jgi:uncharacterized membrane-anchored protein